MTPLEKSLYKTRRTVREACIDSNTNYTGNENIYTVSQCSSCSLWLFPKELKNDEDGLPICSPCMMYYGE